MLRPSNAKNLFNTKISASNFIETARNLPPDEYQGILATMQSQPQARKDPLRLISFELMGLIVLIALAIVAFVLIAIQPPRATTPTTHPTASAQPTADPKTPPPTGGPPTLVHVKINTCLLTEGGLVQGYQYHLVSDHLVSGELKPFAEPCMSDGIDLGNTSEITLEIKPPPPPVSRQFEGQVMLSGQPFLGAKVTLLKSGTQNPGTQNWEPADMAVTDVRGHYQLTDSLAVQPEPYRIEVNSPSDSYMIQALQSVPPSGWKIAGGNAIESETAKDQGESDLNFDFTLDHIRLDVKQDALPQGTQFKLQTAATGEQYYIFQELTKTISVTWELSRLPYLLPGKYIIKVWTPPGASDHKASFKCESGKNKLEFAQAKEDENQWGGFESDKQEPLSLDSLSVVCTREKAQDKQWFLGPIGLFPAGQ